MLKFKFVRLIHYPLEPTIYPYQDTHTPTLPGEKWKDIPGFEGYYQASTKGRIRSLDRVIPHPRLYSQTVKGRILKQKVCQNINLKVGDLMFYLQVSLNLEGNQNYFNTRRLVYSTFIQEINYSDDGLIVINIDGDGLNCACENLKLVTMAEKQRRVFERDRNNSTFLKYADRSTWAKPQGRMKPIEQWKEGKRIAQFPSISEASQQTGYGEKEIINVAKGRRQTHAGYSWRYSKK